MIAGVDPLDLLTELESLDYALNAINPDGEIGDRVRSFPGATFSANYVALPTRG
jgi:hypothetical protein